MKTNYNIYQSYIKNKKLKFTGQRKTILDIFGLCKSHVSIDELYQKVRKKDSSVGFATVFRTMKLLVEAGISNEMVFGDKRKRYELCDKSSHAHLVCRQCKKVVEIKDTKIDRMLKNIKEKHGFTISGGNVELFGVCQICAGKNLYE